MGSIKELGLKTAIFLGSNAAIFFLIKYLSSFVLGLFLITQNPFQTLWDFVSSKIGTDFYILHVVGGNVVINFLYFGVGFLFMIMDLTNRPKFLRKYKVSYLKFLKNLTFSDVFCFPSPFTTSSFF